MNRWVWLFGERNGVAVPREPPTGVRVAEQGASELLLTARVDGEDVATVPLTTRQVDDLIARLQALRAGMQ